MFIQTKIQRQFQNKDDKELTTDELNLDNNEKRTLELAYNIGLGDEATREKLYEEALSGKLTSFQKRQVEKVQEGLKEDGKYDGVIDGDFGPKSTEALKQMVQENRRFGEAGRLSENPYYTGLVKKEVGKIFDNDAVSYNEIKEVLRFINPIQDHLKKEQGEETELKEVIDELQKARVFLRSGARSSLLHTDDEVTPGTGILTRLELEKTKAFIGKN